jgi:virginiamycin B lyase
LPSYVPWGIAAGPDGALWLTYGNQIERITTAGGITEYPVFPPTLFSVVSGIAAGPDGALWFTYNRVPAVNSSPAAHIGGNIGRITIAGTITNFPIAAFLGPPQGIAAGPDGALWFPEDSTNKIGRITTSGNLTEYPIPTASARLIYITDLHYGGCRRRIVVYREKR